jgi:CelD/BcsL family acetyltransferase involved in cellulose biosynthesis
MLLEIEDDPMSFLFGVICRGTFHASVTGSRPVMSKYEMGTLTLLQMVDHLVEEKVERLDFGLGDAHYKERFADGSWHEASIQLFADTIRGQFIRGHLGSVGWLNERAHTAMLRMGILNRLKKVWRARVRGRIN